MAFIYFSRCRPPHPLQGRPLVSGLIEADTVEAAKWKLEALFAEKRLPDRADDFEFIDIATVNRAEHGLLAITTMGED